MMYPRHCSQQEILRFAPYSHKGTERTCRTARYSLGLKTGRRICTRCNIELVKKDRPGIIKGPQREGHTESSAVPSSTDLPPPTHTKAAQDGLVPSRLTSWLASTYQTISSALDQATTAPSYLHPSSSSHSSDADKLFPVFSLSVTLPVLSPGQKWTGPLG